MYSASAFAANTFCRSLVAAAFPLFTVQMFSKVCFHCEYVVLSEYLLASYRQLGVNYAATLLGGVGLLLAPSPFLFYKYGARIRASSKFAPCEDLKIAKILAEERAAEEKVTV
jgi:hypothetical protein